MLLDGSCTFIPSLDKNLLDHPYTAFTRSRGVGTDPRSPTSHLIPSPLLSRCLPLEYKVDNNSVIR